MKSHSRHTWISPTGTLGIFCPTLWLPDHRATLTLTRCYARQASEIWRTSRRRGWKSWTVGSPPGQACHSDPHTGRQVSVPLPHPAAGLLVHCKWTTRRTVGQAWHEVWSGWRSPQGKHHLCTWKDVQKDVITTCNQWKYWEGKKWFTDNALERTLSLSHLGRAVWWGHWSGTAWSLCKLSLA